MRGVTVEDAAGKDVLAVVGVEACMEWGKQRSGLKHGRRRGCNLLRTS